jgi:hypothetical protein
MSAGKHGSRSGGKRIALSDEDEYERRLTKLSRSVGAACDEWQLRVNGYRPRGFRDINVPVNKLDGSKFTSLKSNPDSQHDETL